MNQPIPFEEFTARIRAVYPDMRFQEIATAPYVHVFDSEFLQEEFWPVWSETVKEINRKYKNRPLENNAKRGLCDEINKRFVSDLCNSTRQLYGDADVGPGVRECSVLIPEGYALNRVPGYGWHRTAILAVRLKGKPWFPRFEESQLFYANYENTSLVDADAAGVIARECWM